jgi:hypothetical protein
MKTLATVERKKIVPVFQKAADDMWIDEAGHSIPYNRVNIVERLKEKHATKILGEAVKISNQLEKLYEYLNAATISIEEAMRKDNKPLGKKGNYTWYNFDMSVRVQVKMSDTIGFDEAQMVSAKELLESFLSEEVETKNEFVRDLVDDAFSNSNNSVDTKMVFRILKRRLKIPNQKYQQACDIIESAQQLKKSKKYYTISCKNEDNQYQNINLQFSNV